MDFTPTSSADIGDLRILAERLAGTQDNIIDHIVSMGLEVATGQDVLDDLDAGGFLTTCEECGIWAKPHELDTGLCLICEEELEEEIARELEEDEDDDDLDFGFSDDLFDEEDEILDECIGDCIFDETDEDDI